MSFGMLGSPGSGVGRFAQTRGRLGNLAQQGVNYPSPFFDIAHTYLPATVKQMFRWCRYYFLTNPLINATSFKLAEYPVTELIIDHENPRIRAKWLEFFNDHLRFRAFQIESGLDYWTYGNGMVSPGFPFHKYLKCQTCSYTEAAKRIRAHWAFTNFGFRLTCPKCGTTAEAIPSDVFIKDAAGINLIRWNCENVEINYNELSGEETYFYTIPAGVRNDVLVGKKDTVETIPQIFIQAMRERKGVVFSKDNFFHMKRPTLAQQDRGWGIPLILPVLKDTFLLQIMRKANEAICLEHIVPLRIMFPQPGAGSADPYCVSPQTLIETPSGLMPASEIKTGDYLRSHTGAWRVVEGVKARQIAEAEKVFRVKAASLPGFPFEVSEEHPILAVKRTNKRLGRCTFVDPSFIPVKDLKEGDFVAYPTKRKVTRISEIDLAEHLDRTVTENWIYRRLGQEAAEIYEWMEENYTECFKHGERKKFLQNRGWSEESFAAAAAIRSYGSIDRIPRYMPVTKDLATLVGFYLAEGYNGTGNLLSFAFHANEIEYAEQIKTAATALGFRGVTHHTSGSNGRAVHLNDVLLSELLLSLCGQGAFAKRVPALLSESPDDSIVIEMLRTLFAGDGCSFKTETNRVALKTANSSFAIEARRLLLSYGFIGGITKEDPTETSIHKHPAYHLNYNGPAAEGLRLMFASGNPAAAKAFDRTRCGVFVDDYVLLKIDSIEEVDTVPVVIGFQMAEDKSFCVAGVATHNTTINLIDWKEHVAAEISRWRMDSNYIPILPLPIGNQTVGGDGRGLLMFQEMQALSDQIIAGMGVPREFVYGGMQYSGSNVSMRMLENQFLGYIQRQEQMARWVMKRVASFMGWPEVKIRFRPFKMADDIQRKAYLFQLNQAGKISDSTLLADADLDQEKEDEVMLNETSRRFEATKQQQLKMAEIQGEASVIMAKYQAKAQQTTMAAQQGPAAGGEAGDVMGQMGSQLNGAQKQDPNGATGDLNSMAQSLAQQLSVMPPAQQQLALSNLKTQSPELAQLVEQQLQALAPEVDPTMGMGANGAAASQVNMQPQPEARSPRRAAAAI